MRLWESQILVRGATLKPKVPRCSASNSASPTSLMWYSRARSAQEPRADGDRLAHPRALKHRNYREHLRSRGAGGLRRGGRIDGPGARLTDLLSGFVSRAPWTSP